jgi:lambda repressor-like predicted transcriptional regulator
MLVAELRAQGLTLREIAERVGRSRETMRSDLQEAA